MEKVDQYKREDKKTIYKRALKSTFLYGLVMVGVWIFLDAFPSSSLDKTLKLGGLALPVKYLLSIFITGLGVFFVTFLKGRALHDQALERDQALKELARQEKLRGSILESTIAFVVTLDEDFTILSASENTQAVVAFEERDLLHKPLCEFVGLDNTVAIQEGVRFKDVYEIEMTLNSKYGRKIDLYGRIKKDPIGQEQTTYTFILYDIGLRKSLQEKINYMDTYDPLTDLPNRDLMEKSFNSLLPYIDKTGQPIALIYADIDDFAFINETKSHLAGDKLLRDVAQRIKAIVGQRDLVGRITQDEFAIVLMDLASLEEVDKRVNEIIKEIRMEWQYGEDKYLVTATMGLAVYPKDGINFISLLKSANLALECAKENSRSYYEYYSKDQKCSAIKDLSITSDIKTAIRLGQFQMYYQPINNLKTGYFENAEALIRWPNPEGGFISPAYFIPIAERAGMIDEIGDFTLERVFAQKEEWKKAGLNIEKLSINVSAISFSREGFASYIEEKLLRYGLRGEEIVLELTETSFSTHRNKIKKNIDELRNMGIEIAMDDFGTGYSSLDRLKDLRIDYLKLDRAFIVSLLEENGQEIIKPFISLAKALGIVVIAEGIETLDQYKLLKKLGCQLGQGYFMARPMPGKDLAFLLKGQNKENH